MEIKAVVIMKLDEDGRPPNKWLPDAIQESLEDGEEILSYEQFEQLDKEANKDALIGMAESIVDRLDVGDLENYVQEHLIQFWCDHPLDFKEDCMGNKEFVAWQS